MLRVPYLCLLGLLVSCVGSPNTFERSPTNVSEPASELMVKPVTTTDSVDTLPVADVMSVAVTGEAGNYMFAVTISSDDTGCEQYADWWEVVDTQTGNLLYRRVLAHSHTNEQPFTRSGGPVAIESTQDVLVRAHMGGLQKHYAGQSLGGSVDAGFQPVIDSLPSLETVAPLPKGCAF